MQERPRRLRDALPVWTRVAVYSFGGPAGQIAVMQRILVDERGWISQRRFLHALNYCMLLPGPEAQQLATYVGWLLHRWRGGLVAGGLFVLPGFLSILALSVLYAGWRDAPLVDALFYGIKPAVLAVVLEAVVRIGGRALGARDLQAIAALAFLAMFGFAVPFPAIVGAAAAGGWIGARVGRAAFLPDHAQGAEIEEAAPSPRPVRTVATVFLWLAIWWVPVGLLLLVVGRDHVLVEEAVFFSKTAVVTFGGAYAVLAYVAQVAVETHGWLAPGEMLDGLGLAETTPGPLIQVVQFVGFMGAWRHPGGLDPLAAGVLSSIVTTWVTFVPCFLFVFAGAPYVEHLRGRRSLNGALTAITAAVVGVILNLAVWFAVRTLFARTAGFAGWGLEFDRPVWSSLDPWAAAIAVAAGWALFRGRAGMLAVLAGGAAAGIAIRLSGLA